MNPGIFLIQENGDLIEMNEQAYDSESLLESMLAKYPALLAGNQIDVEEVKAAQQQQSTAPLSRSAQL